MGARDDEQPLSQSSTSPAAVVPLSHTSSTESDATSSAQAAEPAAAGGEPWRPPTRAGACASPLSASAALQAWVSGRPRYTYASLPLSCQCGC